MKRVIGGLDLGQSADYSALVVADVDRSDDPDQSGRIQGEPPVQLVKVNVRHLHRWHLGTKYPEIVADLKKWYTTVPFWVGSTLVVDGTGVGRGVVDFVREAKLPCEFKPYSITAGREPNEDTEDGKMPTVPKKDLVAAVAVALETGRLKIAAQLALKTILDKELENFRVKIDAITRNETFGEWRDGANDDLVLALALLVWYAERGSSYDGVVFPPNDKPLLPRRYTDRRM